MNWVKPPKVELGATIGVMAPSWWVSEENLVAGTALLEAFGYDIYLHPQTEERDMKRQIASSPQVRSRALEDLFKDDSVHAVMAAKGAYGCHQFISEINYDVIRENPKPLIGFSDITTLLGAVSYHTGLQCIHGPVLDWLARYPEKLSLESLQQALEGKSTVELGGTPMQSGVARGRLLGGNLTVMAHMVGTPFLFPHSQDVILFLEEIGEEINDIDRCLHHMRLAGVFERINVTGVIVGEFTNMNDNQIPFGMTPEEVVRSHFPNVPLVQGVKCGHGGELISFPYGAEVELIVKEESVLQVK